ncbi:MAG TPA: CRTAC1 family protein, partial [Acidobacteriaceae bacterium]|nr:CRTAC1 family protein [Acidobacteriaceae bacterium]
MSLHPHLGAVVVLLGFLPVAAQTTSDTRLAGASGQQGGMATAGPQKAQFDSQHRPITAGGLVKTGPVIFMDIAEKAGLTRWHNVTGTPQKHIIVEAKGSGVALLDYDNDGWLDI